MKKNVQSHTPQCQNDDGESLKADWECDGRKAERWLKKLLQKPRAKLIQKIGASAAIPRSCASVLTAARCAAYRPANSKARWTVGYALGGMTRCTTGCAGRREARCTGKHTRTASATLRRKRTLISRPLNELSSRKTTRTPVRQTLRRTRPGNPMRPILGQPPSPPPPPPRVHLRPSPPSPPPSSSSSPLPSSASPGSP